MQRVTQSQYIIKTSFRPTGLTCCKPKHTQELPVSCVCYFPVEFQGIFATQSSVSGGAVHRYSQVTILPDAIPVWGVCYSREGNNVVLFDRTGGQNCIRCFHIALHSGNVIQVYTEGLDKCYTTEEAARETCPTLADIQARRTREIMLYKSRSFSREGLIDRIHCPIDGRYRFTYNLNDGTEDTVECPEPFSQVANCPHGSQLQLSFRRCSFGQLETGLRCLGDWRGYDGQRYLALWDPDVTSDNHPRYRCAMYAEEEGSSRIFLSFSMDATCTNHLHSPWDGYENLVLYPATPPVPPAVVHTTACAFPEWAQGTWQNLKVDVNELKYNDATTDKTYRNICLSHHSHQAHRYALYSQTQCGEETFTCVWIKQRDTNVLEFQMATSPSEVYNATHLCSDNMFRGQQWITQGNLRPKEQPGCPIAGDYTGVIPDAQDLCARLNSDCRNPEVMHYTVSACANASHVYEERKYRCLGQWEEAGVTFTYTHRQDVNTYECFAGVVVNSQEIYIIEAGKSCKRGLQPLAFGMKLSMRASCEDTIATSPSTVDQGSKEKGPSDNGNNQDSAHNVSDSAGSGSSLPWWPSTRNSWHKKSTSTTPKPAWKNEKPRAEASNGVGFVTSLLHVITSVCVLMLTKS
ncbi:uncharacterized protein LOC143018485 [Oratosquilla oratoria]|uniref:uncharacterized protein LOC143018485 n=1 Tax=Oratosquilla oratoria TaxID=337810 RepID=UPI003F757433